MTERNQQFDTFDQWTRHAFTWLTGHDDYSGEQHNAFRAICFDVTGRLCRNGMDFHRARDEDAFPVRWLWPDQVGPVVDALEHFTGEWSTLNSACAAAARRVLPSLR